MPPEELNSLNFQDFLKDLKVSDLKIGFPITWISFPQADMTISLKDFEKSMVKFCPPNTYLKKTAGHEGGTGQGVWNISDL